MNYCYIEEILTSFISYRLEIIHPWKRLNFVDIVRVGQGCEVVTINVTQIASYHYKENKEVFSRHIKM